MNVPDDCKTIYVDQTISNDICNGSYTLDEATQKWVNDNDPKCKLTKIFDSTTGQYQWAFTIEVPEGSDPPPGSVYAVTFPFYENYEIIHGVYVETNDPEYRQGYMNPQWNRLEAFESDIPFGSGIVYPDAYQWDKSKALPSIIEFGDEQ